MPETPQLRWGFIGTGSIANWMAAVVGSTPSACLAAVASRRIDSARIFAEKHGASRAFDDWREMLESDDVDAVYIATPTSLREEIGVAAAAAGKHVLGEKPFASLPSLRHITAACRESGVAFMDATHFAHHPRTAAIRAVVTDEIGRPATLDSAFLVGLGNRGDIRYDPALEPMGAIGDVGWYNMRAVVEYLPADAGPETVSASIRRDARTGAAIAGSGLLAFEDGSTATWSCGFDAGADVIEMRIAGPGGSIHADRFIGEEPDGSASFRRRQGGGGNLAEEIVRIGSELSAPALMFEEFAAIVAEASRRERWMRSSERTQALLDAVWQRGSD